jgi:capsular exopolysaccharide synthesis family protein
MKLINNSKKREVFNKNDVRKLLKNESPFAVKEAYSAIRTSIMYMNMGQKCPVYAVTSPLSNDGKTINCVNLAISFAMLGKKTLLIDGDMRNPTIQNYFGTMTENGMSEILAGFESNISFESTEIPTLKYLKAGKVPPNPAELLSGGRLDKLIEIAQDHFEYIFIDTPPVCIVTDATVLSKKVTGYIFIVKDGRSDIFIVKQAVGIVEQVGGNIIGFILNDVNPKRMPLSRKYEHHYKYGYGYASK